MNDLAALKSVRMWTTADKADWPRGEWDDEPDKVQWIDAETGMPCLIVRGQSGFLCGYAGVAQDHPWFGKDGSDCLLPEARPAGEEPDDPHYSADPDSYYQRRSVKKLRCGESWCGHTPDCTVDVHGGITFAGPCAETDDPSRYICHIPEPGASDNIWWFGFDCGHLHDITPTAGSAFNEPGSSYRHAGYVVDQVTLLAKQLAEASP